MEQATSQLTLKKHHFVSIRYYLICKTALGIRLPVIKSGVCVPWTLRSCLFFDRLFAFPFADETPFGYFDLAQHMPNRAVETPVWDLLPEGKSESSIPVDTLRCQIGCVVILYLRVPSCRVVELPEVLYFPGVNISTFYRFPSLQRRMQRCSSRIYYLRRYLL